jgi:hypothetical protein
MGRYVVVRNRAQTFINTIKTQAIQIIAKYSFIQWPAALVLFIADIKKGSL